MRKYLVRAKDADGAMVEAHKVAEGQRKEFLDFVNKDIEELGRRRPP